MAHRKKLREYLKMAWSEALAAYASRLINSERGLQVHFCAALLQCVGNNRQTKLFIEPKVKFGDKWVHPDVVICNRDRIVAVVELKFAPRGRPSADKDIATLMKFHRASGKTRLLNERYLGPTTTKEYPVASDAILGWAAIYRGPAIDLPPKNTASIGNKFLLLQALTASNKNPEI